MEAILRAIADSGLDPSVIDGVFTDAQVMPYLFPVDKLEGSISLPNLEQIGCFSVAGTGTGYATLQAAEAVRTGRCRAVLVYFGVDWGSNSGGPYAFHDRYLSKRHFERPYGFYGQPLYYANYARRYAHKYGHSLETLSAALGTVAVHQRSMALKNGNAQKTTPLTKDDYAQSRMIADPLRLFDCCLISDGAGAFIVTDASRAQDHSDHPLVQILGVGYGRQPLTEENFFTQNPDLPGMPAARSSARRAFEQAGLKPEDLDFAEIYDCFTISVLIQLEELGVCRPGEAASLLAADGGDFLEKLPVNTHGGFLSQAYLLGINHITEAVRQLRGTAGSGQLPNPELCAVTMSPSRDHTTMILAKGGAR